MLRKFFLLLLVVLGLSAGVSVAQNADKVFQTQVRVADVTTLKAGQTVIGLWGIEAIEGMGYQQNIKARLALESAIGGAAVECEWKSRVGDNYFAQCVSQNDIDLGLYAVQQGYALVDRGAVYNTVFETPYLQAESAAQESSLGIWGQGNIGSGAAGGALAQSWFLVVLLIFFVAIVGVFGLIAMRIMNGFRDISAAQVENLNLLSKQRELQEKERGIVAVMLESEIKANRAKIQAYLVVYEEMVAQLRNMDDEPKYKQMGDIVQKQPALDRQVFDRNTDKLDVLGGELSSALIHFYARIKSQPEYENLEPEMERLDAISIVENAIENAQRLNMISGDLLDAFANYAYGDILDES